MVRLPSPLTGRGLIFLIPDWQCGRFRDVVLHSPVGTACSILKTASAICIQLFEPSSLFAGNLQPAARRLSPCSPAFLDRAFAGYRKFLSFRQSTQTISFRGLDAAFDNIQFILDGVDFFIQGFGEQKSIRHCQAPSESAGAQPAFSHQRYWVLSLNSASN